MMKILFLFFLLLNAVYFYVQFDDANQPVSSILKQPPLPKGVEELALLRERGLGGQNTRLPAKASRKPTAQKIAKSPRAKSAAQPIKTAAKKPERKKPSPKPREPACFTMGPFSTAEIASRSAASLSELGVEVERRQVSRRTPKGYWVYLPASKSYQAAKRKVSELRKRGLKDLFIMGKGSRKNAISLGLFQRKEAADDRYKRVRKMGLKAILETQYRLSEQAWLDMTVSDGKTSTVAAITEMADGVPQAELSQRKCQ